MDKLLSSRRWFVFGMGGLILVVLGTLLGPGISTIVNNVNNVGSAIVSADGGKPVVTVDNVADLIAANDAAGPGGVVIEIEAGVYPIGDLTLKPHVEIRGENELPGPPSEFVTADPETRLQGRIFAGQDNVIAQLTVEGIADVANIEVLPGPDGKASVEVRDSILEDGRFGIRVLQQDEPGSRSSLVAKGNIFRRHDRIDLLLIKVRSDGAEVEALVVGNHFFGLAGAFANRGILVNNLATDDSRTDVVSTDNRYVNEGNGNFGLSGAITAFVATAADPLIGAGAPVSGNRFNLLSLRDEFLGGDGGGAIRVVAANHPGFTTAPFEPAEDNVADVRILRGKFKGNFIAIPGGRREKRDITLTGGEDPSNNNMVAVRMLANKALDGDGVIAANRSVSITDPFDDISPSTNEVVFGQAEASLRNANKGFVTFPDPGAVTFLGPK